MITQKIVSTPVITNIGSKPTQFRIKAGPKSFKVLSGFYSEPIVAIPRELGANAWDAHVAAKNTDVTFDVHAPNQLEPWYSIRDYGTGMSPENIDKIYTTYFESTKTEDNDSDGCMGLGSKTPLNYTENFTVCSWFEGMKYIYNVFIDESKTPSYMFVYKEPSTEHNGLEIKFSVKSSDINTFTDAIRRAYEPFRHRPNIKGADIKFIPRSYVNEGTGWGYRDGNINKYSRENRAFMGNYSYPINYQSIQSYINSISNRTDAVDHIYKAMCSGRFDLFFEIGDLEVAPNKEQLQYDGENKTAKAIVDRMLTAIGQLKEVINQQLEVPKTRWEAMKLFAKYNSYNSPYYDIKSIIGDIKVRFNGEIIDYSTLSTNRINEVLGLIGKNGDFGEFTVLPNLFKFMRIYHHRRSDKYSLKRGEQMYSIQPSNDADYLFLYTNKESIKRSRMRHFFKQKYPTKIPDSIVIIIDESPECSVLSAHRKYLGIEDEHFINMDTFPLPPKSPKENKIKTDDIPFHKFTSCYNNRNGVKWNQTPKEFNGTETYYYLDLSYQDIIWKKKIVDLTNVVNLLNYASENKLVADGEIIYGINRKNVHVLKVGKWINIINIVEKFVTNNNDIEHDFYLIGIRSGNLRYLNTISSFFPSETTLNNKLNNKDSVKLIKNIIDAHSTLNRISNLVEPICNFFGLKATPKIPLDVESMKISLTKKYHGFFDLITLYQCTMNQDSFYQILNMLDEKSNNKS